MTAAILQPLDKAAFFDWAERQDRRYELVDGQVRMLPYVTRNHNQITTNIVGALLARIDRSRFAVRTGDFAVETAEHRLRYADVMVEPRGGERRGRWTSHAILVVEVLSKSTADVDFIEKLSEYSRLAACDTYLICAQDRPVVWQWTRNDGVWPKQPLELEGLDKSVEVAVLGCRVPLAEIYFDALD